MNGIMNREEMKRAKAVISRYSQEQIDYIMDVRRDINSIISDYYSTLDAGSSVGADISMCLSDWKEGAVEGDILTEDEFEELYEAVDIAYTRAYAFA